MRFIGLDVHLDFCEIAICEAGRVRSGGRVASTPEGLQMLADSLGPDDHVALEATGNALAIARLLEPHAARVVVAARKELRAITEAKVKTDRRDARTLARLLAAGLLGGCWLPDETTRALRRRLARRAQLVRQRTRCKNEVHAVLMRNLKGRPPMTDAFGKRGRAWLTELELPGDERQTVDGCLRQIDFLDAEIAILEQAVAELALGSQDIKRLMTVPGVSLMTAATFIAAVGDIRRFPAPGQLVSYLGLDPTVRQSGSGPARHGRISKQGASQVRQMLTESALVSVSTAGPLRAFYERVRATRPPDRHRRRRAQARRALLAPAHPRAGLRVRAPVANAQEAPPARTPRRRRAPTRKARPPDQEHLQPARTPRTRTRALPAGRNRLPPLSRRLESHRPGEGGYGRDTGARISTALQSAPSRRITCVRVESRHLA